MGKNIPKKQKYSKELYYENIRSSFIEHEIIYILFLSPLIKSIFIIVCYAIKVYSPIKENSFFYIYENRYARQCARAYSNINCVKMLLFPLH